MDARQIDANLTDSGFYAGNDHHELFARLRHDDPVHWTQGDYARGFWSLTRFDDIKYVLDRPELFSSEAGTHLPPNGEDLTPEQRHQMGYDAQLVVMDPPDHREKRRPFNKHFSVPGVSHLAESCRGIVDSILDDTEGRDVVDLVEDMVAPLPVILFLDMMGIPRDDWAQIRELAMKQSDPENPENRRPGQTGNEARAEAVSALYDYAFKHNAMRRANPADDFTSIITSAQIAGEPLPERDAAWLSWSMLGGSLETTRSAAAIGVYELMSRPEQAALLSDPDVAKSATEEILRWSTPSKNRLRVAREDVEIGGKVIKKGDWIVNWIVSANRDESVFERADEFDVLRKPNQHLAFGIGEHMCLGRNIARLELQALLPAVFARYPGIKPAGPVDWVASTNSTGIKRLDVRLAS